MRNLVFIFAILFTAFSAQAQMGVTITGNTTGTALSATVGVTSNYNSFGVSCASATTNSGSNTNSNGIIQVSVTGGSANFTYKLYTGSSATGAALDSATVSATSKNFTGLLGKVGAGQAYTATVEDANGCVASIAAPTKSVTAPDTLIASVAQTTPDLCQANSGVATVTVAGGVANYTFASVGATAVSPFTGTPATPAIATPTVSALTNTATGLSGNSNYTFKITDANGCVVQ